MLHRWPAVLLESLRSVLRVALEKRLSRCDHTDVVQEADRLLLEPLSVCQSVLPALSAAERWAAGTLCS